MSSRRTHREALLEAAKQLLRERGYADITARDLVAASNTNLGSIGYHFGSKDELLNEAIGAALEEWAQAVAEASRTRANATPRQLLAASFRAVFDGFDQVRPYFLAFIEVLSRSAREPELAEKLALHYEKQRERVAQMLTAALGESVRAEDARRVATCMIAISDGLMLQALVDPARLPTVNQLSASARRLFASALELGAAGS